MSHFIVAVITKEPAKYHEDLAPYQENNMGDCPKEFLEFNDLTEEFKKLGEKEAPKWSGSQTETSSGLGTKG